MLTNVPVGVLAALVIVCCINAFPCAAQFTESGTSIGTPFSLEEPISSGDSGIAALQWSYSGYPPDTRRSSESSSPTTGGNGKVSVVVYRTPASFSFGRSWVEFPTSNDYKEPTSTDYLTNQETTLWFTSGGGALRTASSDVHSMLSPGESPKSHSSDESYTNTWFSYIVLTLAGVGVAAVLVFCFGALIGTTRRLRIERRFYTTAATAAKKDADDYIDDDDEAGDGTGEPIRDTRDISYTRKLWRSFTRQIKSRFSSSQVTEELVLETDL